MKSQVGRRSQCASPDQLGGTMWAASNSAFAFTLSRSVTAKMSTAEPGTRGNGTYQISTYQGTYQADGLRHSWKSVIPSPFR